MFSLFKKELKVFFSSLIGYIVIIVFLITNSLFIWVFKGDQNILDSGFSSLDSLFVLSPWIFLLLVPAVTMRLFSEEKRTGTIELLLTHPVSDLQLVLSKYFAGLILILFSILPTLLYYLSVYLLGNPVGNIDTGGTWGSYIGLFFLAAVYGSIGLFASSISENQIISFIIALLVCFLFYIGFDYISVLGFWGKMQSFIIALGINSHYNSMSRGVVDSRDLFYFLSVISVFILATKIVIESRKW